MITIITTATRPQMLLECALSVAVQSVQPYWLIYVDDNMTPFHTVLDKIRCIVPHCTVVGGKKKGRVIALHEVHQMVETEYCGWLDDDDWLDHRCIAMCQSVIAEYRSPFIYTDYYDVIGSVARVGKRNREPFNYARMLQQNIVHHFRVYSMDLYRSCGGVNLDYDIAIDYEMCLRMLAVVQPHKVDMPLYYYRRHGDRMGVKQSKAQIDNFWRASRDNQHRLVSHGY